MDSETKRTAFAAACILLGFGLTAFYMPNIVLFLGGFSPWIGFAFAVLFVVAFFGVFWLRGRSRRGS